MDDKDKSKVIELAKDLINKYRSSYADVDLDVLKNLIALKEISNQHKTETPDQQFTQIKERLGEAESAETLRQERWHNKVRCLFCGSNNIKRLGVQQQKSKHIYKYQCLDCEESFNDDSQTDIEKGVPPLYSWMLCWYLLGCTSSVQYIAQKLGLDLATVEMMIQHMQKIFKAEKPLSNLMSFDEWSLKHGKSYQNALKETLLKKDEILRGYSLGQEKDTHEVRRQKERAPQPNKPKPTRS